MQGEAMKDAKGLPPNMKAPVDRQWFRTFAPWQPWWRVSVTVRRQRYADVEHAFSGGAFVHGWWDFYVQVIACGHLVQLWRWRERWAV